MSDATLQAVQEAIAAHIADEADSVEYLIEWVAIGAAAIADDPTKTMYYKLHQTMPYHHTIGLMERGMELLRNPE